jgi:phage terminase large subunit GpA-like protein
MSKTEGVLLNQIGRIMDDDPRPMMYVGPTEKNVLSISNSRVTPMIKGVPTLKEALAGGHKDKTTEKFINGVRLGFAWAGSPTELASHPNAWVLIDERDRMGPVSEGDVDTIVNSSVSTYDGVIIRVSTPLEGDVSRAPKTEGSCDHWEVASDEDVSSPIWRWWQNGSKHEWAAPCPHCKEYFIPHMDLIVYADQLTARQISETAYLACPNNGCEIYNDDKEWMNERGVFIAPCQTVKPVTARSKTVNIEGEKVAFGSYLDEGEPDMSFWVSGVMSPWRPFGAAAKTLFEAKKSGDPKKEQGVINTEFGQVYKHRGQAVDWHIVQELKQGYEKRSVPEGVKVLTFGVDTHKERLNYVIRGWGVNYESWLIDCGELFGQTKFLDSLPWRQLADILMTTFDDMPVAFGLIDAGYKPNDDEPAPSSTVYQFCYKHKRIEPAKGHDTRTRSHSPSQIDVTYNGKVVSGGLRLWHLDSDFFKSFIYSRLEWPEDQPGGFHLPVDVEDEYCKQVVAEQRIVLPSGKPKWKKIRRDNHYLDCEMQAAAAAFILRLHNLTDEDQPGKPVKRQRRTHGGLRR